MSDVPPLLALNSWAGHPLTHTRSGLADPDLTFGHTPPALQLAANVSAYPGALPVCPETHELLRCVCTASPLSSFLSVIFAMPERNGPLHPTPHPPSLGSR